MADAYRPSIGVFDSGVGGLSVLRELQLAAPASELIYVADSAHAPYGERSDHYVVERSLAVTRHLIDAGAQLIVVACNTATAAAIEMLRKHWPAVPFVGVEPGLKPAVQATRNGRIGVMATPSTLASERFRRLLSAQPEGVHIIAQPCAGLAGMIEAIDVSSSAIDEAVARYCGALRDAEVDVVVLGCTHYAFVAARIQEAVGSGVRLIDTAQAVARQAQRVIAKGASAHPQTASPMPRLITTGSLATFERVADQLWPWPATRHALRIDQSELQRRL